MKKIIVVLLLLISFCANSCFAVAYKFSKDIQQKYSNEINSIILSETIKKKNEANEVLQKAQGIYNAFLQNKNQMKLNNDYIIQLSECEMMAETPEFELYLQIIDATEKYADIENEIPATDYAGALADFIFPYLKKNKVSHFKDLLVFSSDIATIISQITEYKTIISEYSHKYEKAKIENFYNKTILPRLEATKLTNLFYVFMYNESPKVGVHYFAKPEVIQILTNGFLADLGASYYNSVIYVKDNNSKKLWVGDVFDPFIPLKFTGQYFYYTNLFGERRKAPIMVIAFPSCTNKTLPQIGETFYFEEKPHYSYNNSNYCSKDIYVINDRRAYYNGGNPYFKWK